MKNKSIRIISILVLLFFCAVNFSFAADSSTTAEPYKKNEFPMWAKDIRRTEIITFGSLPFVTLWVTVGYSAIVNGEFHNPLDKSSSSFSSDDQKTIIKIAALSSLALGFTDLTINLIQRGVHGAHAKKMKTADAITIIPYKQPGEMNPDDQNLKNKSDEEPAPPPAPEKPTEYLQGGIESAIF